MIRVAPELSSRAASNAVFAADRRTHLISRSIPQSLLIKVTSREVKTL